MDRFTERDLRIGELQQAATVYEAIHDLPSPRQANLDALGEYVCRYGRAPDRGPLGDYARSARQTPSGSLASAEIRRAFAAGLITGFKPTVHTSPVLGRMSDVPQGGVDAVSRCPRLAWEQPCPTLRAGTGPERGSFQSIRPIHPVEDRVITVREAARLQGFPDWFRFHTTQWHSFRMIGNSVSPLLARAVLSMLRSRMEKVSPNEAKCA